MENKTKLYDFYDKILNCLVINARAKTKTYKRKGYYIPNFNLKDNTKHKLISSVGKLNSVAKITEEESKNLGDDLRLLILTDYIKKESIKEL